MEKRNIQFETDLVQMPAGPLEVSRFGLVYFEAVRQGNALRDRRLAPRDPAVSGFPLTTTVRNLAPYAPVHSGYENPWHATARSRRSTVSSCLWMSAPLENRQHDGAAAAGAGRSRSNQLHQHGSNAGLAACPR